MHIIILKYTLIKNMQKDIGQIQTKAPPWKERIFSSASTAMIIITFINQWRYRWPKTRSVFTVLSMTEAKKEKRGGRRYHHPDESN